MNQTEHYKRQILETINNTPRHPEHCHHGVYIGNWAGADIMCHYCEAGITDDQIAQAKAEWITERVNESVQAASTLHDNGLISATQYAHLILAAIDKFEPR